MTLQLVHKETRPIRASSLYCFWIPAPGEDGACRAIWMDSEMRGFEEQITGGPGEGAFVDEAGESHRQNASSAEARVLDPYKRS